MNRRCPSCNQLNRIPAKHLADNGKCGACKAPLAALGKPVDVGPREFDDIVRNAKVPVLVDFWAAWCGPCRMAAPAVAEVAAVKRGKALVLKVDTEKHPELAARYNVRGIPNFGVFRGGRLVAQHAGLTSAAQMSSWLDLA